MSQAIAYPIAAANQSGAFVLSVPQFIPRAAFPDDFPIDLPERDVYGNGGAVIVEPTWGKVIAGPLYGEEGIVAADCDLREGLHAKRWFDAVGHYSREDVLAPPAPAVDGGDGVGEDAPVSEPERRS